MFSKTQLEKYADVLLWGMQTARSQDFHSGDIILIRYDLPGRELTEILFEKILHKGMHPLQRINQSPKMDYALFSTGSDPQLTFLPPGEEELMHNLHGSISILAPESLTHLKNISPENIGKSVLAKKKLRDILDERENHGLFGWTLCLLTTKELAKNAGLSEKDYSQQIIKACYLDYPDPIAKWKEIFSAASEIKEFLNKLPAQEFHLESDHCDLIITLGEERRWVGVSGHNIPSFEIFTSPDWRGTEGVFFMDQPSYRSGNLVKNLRIEFKKGDVAKVEAGEGENFVKKQITIDNNANKLGEFSLTDIRFSRIDKFMAHTLFDENYGGDFGNCHIALGASYAETYALGGKNLNEEKKESLGFNDSALHWDLVNTEPKRVTAKLKDGHKRVIYENGTFQV